jgi:hypothetical protein
VSYSEDQLKKIVHCGILGYPAQKCINILDIENEAQFIIDFENPETEIAKAYQKGVDKGEYQIDMKLYQKAAEGDLKALAELEKRKSYR